MTDHPDRLTLRDHIVEADIGAFEEERGRLQRLRFEVEVALAASQGAGDDVDGILSYDVLTGAIAAALAAERRALLEVLAEDIAARILSAPQAARVFVRVEKLDRASGALGVAITRSGGASAPARAAEEPGGRLVLLSQAAAEAADLPQAGAAVLLAEARRAPRAQDPEAQRRIDLLALDQAAWLLAARLGGMAVAATRTELEHGLRQGGPVVWAPSRLVLSQPEAPQRVEAPRLAAWLAEAMGLQEILALGCAPPETRLPVRSLPLDAAGAP
ncbi:dihydroneopterin aldolase [Pseudoroseicyclus aestuarii]|uniref:dihydroneopterin aldolase n=1 Tax=Pseudoroseicyclus aestuarii TaxID=1795041 RepID=A0A318SV00_9RHOB|nr:dihydroneopterin aldolase [Pseudoroseicyclus aestuarii]PYE85740.1 dihydroneopterin aldolase [Pseudoroseicyclus aestuarii]